MATNSYTCKDAKKFILKKSTYVKAKRQRVCLVNCGHFPLMLNKVISPRPFILLTFGVLVGVLAAWWAAVGIMPFLLLSGAMFFVYFFLQRTFRQGSVLFFLFAGLGGAMMSNEMQRSAVPIDWSQWKNITGRIHKIKVKKDKYQCVVHTVIDEYAYALIVTVPKQCDRLIRPNDLISIPTNKIFQPRGATVPGGFNYRMYLENQRIGWVSYPRCDEIDLISKPSSSLQRLIFTMHTAFIDKINRVFREAASAALVQGILIGYKEEMASEQRTLFSAAGIGHVFAVSGMHVGMMYALCLPLLLFRYRRAWTRWALPMIALVLVWLFILAAGATPSAVRAGLMISLYELGKMSYLPADRWNILAAVAFFNLIIHPTVLFDIGFQFSYLALVGIFFFYPRLTATWLPRNTLAKGVMCLIYLSCSAQLVLLPLSLFYFHSFSPMFWLNGLVATLVVQCNFVISLLAVALEGIPNISFFFVGLVDYLFNFMEQCIAAIMTYSFAQVSFHPSAKWVLFSYAALSSVMVGLSYHKAKSVLKGICLFWICTIFVDLMYSTDELPVELTIFHQEEPVLQVSSGGRVYKEVDLSEGRLVDYYGTTVACLGTSGIADMPDVLVVVDDISAHQIAPFTTIDELVINKGLTYRTRKLLERHCNEYNIPYTHLSKSYFNRTL